MEGVNQDSLDKIPYAIYNSYAIKIILSIG